jgi:phosphohistidine phosphatase
MQVYLLRHGVAEEGGASMNDADRALTAEGRQKLREVLRAAANAEVQPTLILTSPLKRAVQTAEIAKDILGCKNDLVRSKTLVPGATVDLVWEDIRAHRNEEQLMLVGHDPLFSHLGGYLLGSASLKIDFKKGSILRVDFENFPSHPHGILRWYMTAKLAATRARNVGKASGGAR